MHDHLTVRQLQALARTAAQQAHRAAALPSHAAHHALDWAKHLWRAHDRLMRTDPLYRTAVTSIAGLLACQIDIQRLLMSLFGALLNAFNDARDHRTGRLRPYWEDDDPDW